MWNSPQVIAEMKRLCGDHCPDWLEKARRIADLPRYGSLKRDGNAHAMRLPPLARGGLLDIEVFCREMLYVSEHLHGRWIVSYAVNPKGYLFELEDDAILLRLWRA